MTLRLLPACLTLALVLGASVAQGKDPASAGEAWRKRAAADVQRGRPLVVRVVVALCDNALVDCGSQLAGRPSNLRHNLYWGAIFGAQRFLERKRSQYKLLGVSVPGGPILERRIYERFAAGKGWGLEGSGKVRQLVVLDAVDGRFIDSAVDDFFHSAASAGTVAISPSETLPVHVSGFVGHNRLMDGKRLPRAAAGGTPSASFVLACDSEPYFAASLREAGSTPVVMTRALMAPEGYVLAAVLRGLGDGKPRKAIRRDAVLAYAKYQKLSYGQASWIFSSR